MPKFSLRIYLVLDWSILPTRLPADECWPISITLAWAEFLSHLRRQVDKVFRCFTVMALPITATQSLPVSQWTIKSKFLLPVSKLGCVRAAPFPRMRLEMVGMSTQYETSTKSSKLLAWLMETQWSSRKHVKKLESNPFIIHSGNNFHTCTFFVLSHPTSYTNYIKVLSDTSSAG
jgi:hypothetical protein